MNCPCCHKDMYYFDHAWFCKYPGCSLTFIQYKKSYKPQLNHHVRPKMLNKKPEGSK